jgi:hypothetical protein
MPKYKVPADITWLIEIAIEATNEGQVFHRKKPLAALLIALS